MNVRGPLAPPRLAIARLIAAGATASIVRRV
jgi:hypothetical protein